MHTKIIALLVAALLIGNYSFGNIFRVGYTGPPLAGVDYADLQSAQDAASAGDTLQVYTNITTHGNIDKKLVIIGYGYNFDANANLQVIGTDAPSSADITFSPGSDGSMVSGISGSFGIGDYAGTGIPISNITFQRCNGDFRFYNFIGYSINYGTISNIQISGSVINLRLSYHGTDGTPVNNLQIYNCIVQLIQLFKANTTAIIENCVSASLTYSSFSFLDLNDASVLMKNCIFASSNSMNNINTIYENNFFAEAQPVVLPAGSNNRWSQDWAVIFNRLGGTSDAPGYYADPSFDEDYYVLKAGSPAINAGLDAANNPSDAGIYGGETAYIYKLSGVPAVPANYKLTAPSTVASSNPYNITISVRSNN
ncbi:MAG: hypothetical protein ABI594_07215 [Ginsengibacter sp.]